MYKFCTPINQEEHKTSKTVASALRVYFREKEPVRQEIPFQQHRNAPLLMNHRILDVTECYIGFGK